MSNTVAEILCMKKIEHHMQICLQNLRMACNAEHVLQHAGRTNISMKKLQRDKKSPEDKASVYMRFIDFIQRPIFYSVYGNPTFY